MIIVSDTSPINYLVLIGRIRGIERDSKNIDRRAS
jgi:hypothetical protein